MIDIPSALEERYGKAHLSYSSLKVALTDMAQFDRYMKGELKFESPALEFGTLYDMMLFEPEKVNKNYYIMDDEEIMAALSDKAKSSAKPKMTKEYKELKEVYDSNAKEAGLTMVTKSDYDQAKAMIDRLESCGLSDQYLSSGNYQVEFNEMLGPVKVKGFLDCLGDGYIVDSKSTKSVSKFRYSVRDFCYDIQAYIYTKVFGIKDFWWVVQEKNYPFYPADVKCSEETLFNGEMKFHQAVENINNWLNGNKETVAHYAEFVV